MDDLRIRMEARGNEGRLTVGWPNDLILVNRGRFCNSCGILSRQTFILRIVPTEQKWISLSTDWVHIWETCPVFPTRKRARSAPRTSTARRGRGAWQRKGPAAVHPAN